MSRRIGLDTIALGRTPRPAHTEYSLEYHGGLVRRTLGLPAETPDRVLASPEHRRAFYDAWDFDFLWNTNDGLVDWGLAGRATDMGHAVYAADGGDLRTAGTCPFESPEEVWAFDPTTEYGLPGFDEQVRAYQESFDRNCAQYPNQVCTGGYYRSVVSGAIASFGWDMLLTAAADERAFAAVLRRFGERTLFHARAWAETSIDVYIQHDDMVWTAGPFMHPRVYREVIFPIYRQLWEPLKRKGKKILFCSDGRFDMFMDEVVAAGADGLIFEPCNLYAEVVRRFGGRVCLVGSGVDCRTLTFGSWPEVRAEIDATLALTADLPGIMLAVGNHMPANITDGRCDEYLAYLRKHW